MAIRQRKDGRKKFQVYWNNPFNGKRQSVPCESLEEAQKTDALIKFRLVYEKETFRPKEDEPKKEELKNNTLGGIVYAYLKEKQMDYTGVRTIMTAFTDAIELLGNTQIDEITENDLCRVMYAIQRRGVAPITVACRMKRIKTVFKWARHRHYLDVMPEWPDVPDARYQHFVPPSQDEIARMLEAAPPHIQRVIIVGSRLGVRIGRCELFKMRWDDVDWKRGVVRVKAAKKNLSEPWREVPIKDSLMPLFRHWYEDDLWIRAEYIIHYNGHQMVSIQRAWSEMLKRAGISRRIRPYDLRHAFATEAIAAGADIGTVAKLLGHANANMVLQHYQHVLTSQKKATVESLPELPPMCQPPMCQKGEDTIQ